MQYFYALLFILGIQSCLTEDLAVKKKVSVKPTPKIGEAIQRDLGEVKITEKKIDKLGNNPKFKEAIAESTFNQKNATKNTNGNSTKNMGSAKNTEETLKNQPGQPKSLINSRLVKSPKANSISNIEASSEAYNQKDNGKSREPSGSGLSLNNNVTYSKQIPQDSQVEYGEKSTYAKGFEPKKNPSLLKKEDDIIARQLKNAATTEKDPVLRKKLWDEYERYKKNL